MMWPSHLNDVKIPETKRFIPKGFELGTALSWLNRSISMSETIFGAISCHKINRKIQILIP